MKRSMRDILRDAADPFEDSFDPVLREEMVARSEAIPAPDLSGDKPVTPASPASEPVPPSATTPAVPASGPGAPVAPSAAPPPSSSTPPSPPVAAPVLDPRLAATQAGKSLAASQVIPERLSSRQISDMMRLRRSMDGLITRGDPLPRARSLSAKDQSQALRDLGIPDRPQTWPVFMAWPPQVVLDRFMAPGVTPDQRADMIRLLSRTNDAMLARSRQIKPWFEAHNPIDTQDRASRRSVRMDSADPHYGVKWAILLNPGPQDQATLSTVISWGHCLAVTADGGAVRADNDSLSFERRGTSPVAITPQAVSLAIFEARNRGWGRIRMQGSHEFGMMAIKAAKDAGIDAEIIYSGRGLMSWKTYRVKVTPGLPAPQPLQDDPEAVQSRSGAPAASGATGRTPARSPRDPGYPAITSGQVGGDQPLRGVIPDLSAQIDDPSRSAPAPSP